VTSLYDTWTHQPIYWSSAGAANPCMALDFGNTADVVITGVRYWYDGTHNNRPERLILFDKSTGATLARITPNAGQTTGWVTTPLPAQLSLAAGHSLQICYDGPATQSFPFTDTAAVAPTGLMFGDNRLYNSTALDNPSSPMTGTSSTGSSGLADVVVTVGGTPSEPPATPSDVNDSLAAWLSSLIPPQGHTGDGLPWQNYAVTSVIDATLGRRDSSMAQTVVELLWAALLWMANNPTVVQNAFSWLGQRVFGAGSDDLPTIAEQTRSTVGENHDLLMQIEPLVQSTDTLVRFIRDWVNQLPIDRGELTIVKMLQDLHANLPPPPQPNTLVGETTFDTWLYWNQPANYYLVHFDYTGSALPLATPVGIEYIPRLAWWTPHDGTGGRERRFIDLRDYYCDDGGRMIPGILLHSPATGSGTVQAWTT
jgi:hypothetical protein